MIRIPASLRGRAAARLLAGPMGQAAVADSAVLEVARRDGLDLSLMWAMVCAPRGERGLQVHSPAVRVEQVCLVVPASGRTAMVFLSPPVWRPGASGRESAAAEAGEHADRVACLRAACRELEQHHARSIALLQALPEPEEDWAIAALKETGFVWIADLAYLHRPGDRPLGGADETWPDDVRVRTVRGVKGRGSDRSLLIEALERSYEGTLDCPQLRGLRRTEDVLESHVASGRFDPRWWWLVFREGRPEGCLLMNAVEQGGAAELVYLGLSPGLRGRGLGERLLRLGLATTGWMPVLCAVDRQNVPAMALYERLGFREVGARVALVRPVGAEASACGKGG